METNLLELVQQMQQEINALEAQVKDNQAQQEAQAEEINALEARITNLENQLAQRQTQPTQVAPSVDLPKEAWALLRKAQAGGLLDGEFQPIQPKCSLTTAAILARTIMTEIGWEQCNWIPFERLWVVKQLRTYFTKGNLQEKFYEVDHQICKVLSVAAPVALPIHSAKKL